MSLQCINTTLSVCSDLLSYCNKICANNECYCGCIGNSINNRKKCFDLAIALIPVYIVAPIILIFIIATLSYCCIKKKPKKNTVINHRITAEEWLTPISTSVRPPVYNQMDEYKNNANNANKQNKLDVIIEDINNQDKPPIYTSSII